MSLSTRRRKRWGEFAGYRLFARGNTPESVAAAKLAQQHQAHTITLTHNAQAQLIEYASHSILYARGNDTNVVDNPIAIILNLCVDTFAAGGRFQ